MTDESLAHLENTLLRQHAPTVPEAAGPGVASERYRLGAELGRGGMGRVVEAVDTQFDRVVAIKELLGPPHAGALRRFTTEALVTGNLEHPGIPAVHEQGHPPGSAPFYVMQRVAGRTLTQRCREATTLEQRLALLPAVIQVAQTVGFAHSRGVVHRDLKPDNIIVGDFGQVWVIDWGLARVRGLLDPRSGEGATGTAHQTMAGAVMGTPAYMAPEQAAGETERVDERTDVFALGALLFHVLTGRPPHTGSSIEEVIGRARRAEVPDVRTLAPGIPRALVAICTRAMSRDPALRHANAHALAAELEQCAAGPLAGNRRTVDWVVNALGVLAVVMLLAMAIAIPPGGVMMALDWPSIPTMFLGLCAVAVSALEVFSRGRHRLTGLGLSLAGATALVTIGVTTFTLLGVLQGVMALRDEPEKYAARFPDLTRSVAMWTREVLSQAPLPMVLAGTALVLCGLATRLQPRGRA